MLPVFITVQHDEARSKLLFMPIGDLVAERTENLLYIRHLIRFLNG